ncbi:flagellar protein FlaG [Bacillota bacterium Lsc_1132]
MIERLNGTVPPIQQRTAVDEGAKVNPINKDKAEASSNQFEPKKSQQKDPKKKEKVKEVIKGLNEFLQPTHTSLKFKLHEKLQEYYVTIVDDRTNEVIKEIPAKKLLDTYAAMAEHLGLLVDKKI